MAIEIIGDKTPRVKTHPSTDENFTPSINPKHLTNTLRDAYNQIAYKEASTGQCYADMEWLAGLLGVSVSQAYRITSQLREYGLLRIERARKGVRRLMQTIPYPDEENATETRTKCENNAKIPYNEKRARTRVVSNPQTLNSKYVSPNGILEEKTDKQEEGIDDCRLHEVYTAAVRRDAATDGEGNQRFPQVAVNVETRRRLAGEAVSLTDTQHHLADAPMLPKANSRDAVGCEVGRDTSETPGGWMEEVASSLRSHCVNHCVNCANRLPVQTVEPTRAVESPATPAAVAQPTHSIPQEEVTPAATEATNETTLSEKGMEDSHHDTSRGRGANEGTQGGVRRSSAAVCGGSASQNGTGGIADNGRPDENGGGLLCGKRGRSATPRTGEYSAADGKYPQENDRSLETLTAHGVDVAQAQRIASQHTQEAIARAVAYANQQEVRKGRLTNKAGFIVSALSRQWGFKLLDISPEGIKKRQEKLRYKATGDAETRVRPDVDKSGREAFFAQVRGRVAA